MWVSILSSLLTPTIAVAAIYIAWQQWATNRNKLKLELFERRYAFYEAATEMIGRIMGSGKASDQTTFEFLVKTKGARFIVGADVASYFDRIYRKAVELNGLDSELEWLPVCEDRSRNISHQREIKNWLQAQYAVLDEKFAPLLTLKH